MEESEKRRERLRAMRAEAAEADSHSNSITPSLPTSCLTNPLTEIPSQEEPRSAPRFDFYTDPMSAFSDDKRRIGHFAPPVVNNTSPVLRFPPPPPPGTRNSEAPPQVHQFHGNYSPDQQIHQGQGFIHNPIPHRRPVGMSMSPFNMPQGNLHPSITPGFSGNYNYHSQSPGPRGGRIWSPGFGPTGGPYNAPQGGGQWGNNSPRPGSGYRGSPNPSWGRGGGRWHGSGPSPGSGRRGGRGPGSGGRSFTVDRPLGAERFYSDSMIEDPWKFLEPIVWKEVELPLSGPDSSKPWTPRSLGTKKAKVSDDSNKSGSQPSLAEYLAASFNEAVGDAPSV